jgi:N-methylhydantoinase B
MPELSHGSRGTKQGFDAITTEVVRNALRSGAGQMREVLMRSAFSQLIYEVLDFACGLYDRRARLLAQAESLAMFLGTLDSCVTSAVEAVGGEAQLQEGDILVYNIPYGTGSHPQDAAMVMPAFVDGQLVGYAAVKAHWVDIGGKDVYSSDTRDIQQEGTFYPGVKLFRAGERNEEIWRIILANTRAPRVVSGDINAKVGAVRTGVAALRAVVERHGSDRFEAAIQHGFERSEARMRAFIDQIPDGRYATACAIDSDGLSDEEIVFDIAVEVSGSDLTVDLTGAPDQRPGPVNSPRPGTVSVARVALAALSAVAEAPDDGTFRPLHVRTRPGSLYEPVAPAPAFVFWTAQIELIDAIFRALADALPRHCPADSGGDIAASIWWGAQRAPYQRRSHDDHEPWIDGAPAPVGQGASAAADGQNALMHLSESCTRTSPMEVWEAKNPWVVEKMQLAPDSGGAGRTRGGLGVDCRIRALEDCFVTTTLDQTRRAPQGLFGGCEGRPNGVRIEHADGRVSSESRTTALPIAKGSVFELRTGGGGGYGPPEERDPSAIARDLVEGYITQAYAERYHGWPAQ